jgi:hypothetical protein
VGKAKILAMVFLAALVMTVTPALAAGDTTTLTISVQGPEISMNLGVSPAEWQVQAPSLNATHNSPTYTLTNNGNVLVDTTIVGTDAIGSKGQWELYDMPSSDRFTLSWTATSGSGVISKIPTEFLQNIPAVQSMDFSLQLRTPASGYKAAGDTLQVTVTIKAVQG